MPDPHLPPEFDPSRYIEKVSLTTGELLDDPILPQHLLVRHHRDYHVVDIYTRFLMSKMVHESKDPEQARGRIKQLREMGHKAVGAIAKFAGIKDSTRLGKLLFGLKRKEYYFRFRKHHLTREEIDKRVDRLREEARARLSIRRGLRVLLTGGTGFVGKEVLWQAAHDPMIEEVVVVVRPKEIRDRKTKQLVKTLSPADRGAALLKELWLEEHPGRGKFRFVDGDVEKHGLGISESDRARLKRTITHVIHSAASVSFDDPYEASFRSNVLGTLNALEFSLDLQKAEGSPFIAHLGIETAYIHGRQTHDAAREDDVVFPRNFYNNYYELTKAMGSIETERFMLEKGLRVVQLCPSIVIGEERTGNNRGDTKVVNAPVNAFGRAGQALSMEGKSFGERWKIGIVARLAAVFPGDPMAELNLITVDRVVAGIVAALKTADAVGERIHLATDKRITSARMKDIVKEELNLSIRLREPTIHRNVSLPLITRTLKAMKQGKLADALEKMGHIFGGYAEWGQPIHEVGKDARILGLAEERPDAERSFRMLCRHNRYVNDFGQVRDEMEVSRRERIWRDFIHGLEAQTSKRAGEIEPVEFDRAVREEIELPAFRLHVSVT